MPETTRKFEAAYQELLAAYSGDGQDTGAVTGAEDFDILANSLPIIVCTARPDGWVDYFNDAFERYTGYPAKDYLGHRWVTLIHPDDFEATAALVSAAVVAGEDYRTEYRLRRADGEYRWHAEHARAERDSSGAIMRWWANTTDVQETHLLREEASQLAASRDAILESIGDGVFATDRDFRVTYMNVAAEAALGMKREEFVGHVIWDNYPEVKGTPAEETYRKAMAGEPQHFERYNERLDRWADVSAYPSPEGITIFFRDITEIKSLAEQLAQSQRLEAVGQLTGGIAHDFNNLLTVVVGGSEALAAQPDLSDESREMVTLVSRAATRGAKLTHHLLAFSRRQILDPQAVNLGVAIKHFTPLLRRTLGAGIEIVTHVEKNLPAAAVDPAEFENAMLNLVLNARDAMPDGGTLSLEAGSVVLKEAYDTPHSEVPPGAYVVVTVTDDGNGIPAEIHSHLFDPFFTTKPKGEGSGLGLAMVWGFARQSGGNVTVSSEVGFGTTVQLYLPVSTEPAATPAPAKRHDAAKAGSGHILLAEDDALVRQFAAEHLRSLGYEVTEAGSGQEAVALLEKIPDLALLFTDVIMPGGFTGRDLADAVTARRPGTPVLYASGYTEDVIVHHGRLDPGVDFLPKPYTGNQLAEAVADAIARRSTA